MTNFEKIKNMSIDEYAEFHRKTRDCGNCPALNMCKRDFAVIGLVDVIDCQNRYQNWLESEVTEYYE